MSAAFQVMQNVYENRKTGEKAIGCTIMFSSDFQKLADDIIRKHPEFGDYSEMMGEIVKLGVNEITQKK